MTDIYLITNIITGSQYIGKTQRGYLKRFEQHCLAYSHGNRTYISCAIHKYGRENFSVRLVRQVGDDNWKYWENYYIKLYHTHYTEGGYNVTWGGDDNPMDIPSVQRKHHRKCTSPEFRELQRKLSTGKHHSEKTKELCRRNTLENLDVCIRGFREYNESKKVKVGMIKNGKLLQIFDSASEACQYLGKPTKEAGHILKVCDVITKFGKPAKHFGYNWTRLS